MLGRKGSTQEAEKRTPVHLCPLASSPSEGGGSNFPDDGFFFAAVSSILWVLLWQKQLRGGTGEAVHGTSSFRGFQPIMVRRSFMVVGRILTSW